jgi:hypothetical protein
VIEDWLALLPRMLVPSFALSIFGMMLLDNVRIWMPDCKLKRLLLFQIFKRSGHTSSNSLTD